MVRRSCCFLSFSILIAQMVFFAVTASAQSNAGLRTEAQIQGTVNATANCRSIASNRLGSSDGSGGAGSTQVNVRGSVSSTATCGQESHTVVGDTNRPGQTNVVGNLTNQGGNQEITGKTSVIGDVVTAPGTDVKLGGCGTTSVVGDVYVGQGTLEIGCVCAGRRNGMCCVVFHNSLCVIRQMPPSKYGCPPGFVYSAGLCRLYSDTAHAYGR